MKWRILVIVILMVAVITAAILYYKFITEKPLPAVKEDKPTGPGTNFRFSSSNNGTALRFESMGNNYPGAAPPNYTITSGIDYNTTTNTPYAMQTDFSANMVGAFFSGTPYPGTPGATDPSHYRDIKNNANNWLTRSQALGLNRLLHTGGHIINYWHYSTGVGYEFDINDFNGSQDQTVYDTTDLTTYEGGSGAIAWVNNFTDDFFSFCDNYACGPDIGFNIKHGTTTEMARYFSKTQKPKYVLFGDELLTESGNVWPIGTGGTWDVSDYIGLYNTMATYMIATGGTMAAAGRVLDTGLMYRYLNGHPNTVAWCDGLKAVTTAQHGRQYMQVSDEIVPDSNQANNLAKVIKYFDPANTGTDPSTSLPYVSWIRNLNQFKTLFQNNSFGQFLKVWIAELLIEDNRGGPFYINNFPVGMLALGLSYKTILLQTADISYCAWMSLGNMVGNNDGNEDNNYFLTKIIKPAFTWTNVVQLVFTGTTGIDGIGGTNGSNYYMLIINTSGTDKVIPIKREGATVASVFRDTEYGSALSALTTDVYFETATEPGGSVNIKKYSVNMLWLNPS